MRLVSVALVWVIIIGSVFLYMDQRARNVVSSTVTILEPSPKAAAKPVTFDITTTFSVETDPFALTAGSDNAGHGLILKLGDTMLVNTSEHVQAGIPLSSQPVKGLTAGRHEAYLQASPSNEDGSAHMAARLRIFEGEQLLKEKTFWADPGERISGVLDFELHETGAGEDHEH